MTSENEQIGNKLKVAQIKGRLGRHNEEVQGVLQDLAGLPFLQNISEESVKKPENNQASTSKQNSAPPPNPESLGKHKNNLVTALAELEQAIEGTAKPADPAQPSKKDKKGDDKKPEPQKPVPAPPPPPSHRQNVKNAIHDLTSIDATLEGMKKQEEAPSPRGPSPAPSATPTQASKKVVDVEEILEKKRYLEDEIDFQIAEKNEETDKWYKWVENRMDMVIKQVGFLTLLASALTACACYMFCKLPHDIYVTHVFHEIYLIHDRITTANGFGVEPGIQMATLLPVVIGVMYLSIIYIIYLVQYPQQRNVVRIIRWTTFILFQSYLVVTVISFIIGLISAGERLDEYFKHDKIGLKEGWPEGENHSEPLHGLDHTQEYFGCCGYVNRSEWDEVYPDRYDQDPKTYPLSCCDEEESGIACYSPVEETVTYIPPNEDKDKEVKDPVTKQRIYRGTCRDAQLYMIEFLSSIVIILVLFYIFLSSWTLATVAKICSIVTEKEIIIKPTPQYIDSL